MSIVFSVQGVAVDYESSEGWLNLSNSNAIDLLEWLGVEVTARVMGEMKSSDLAARCRRRLWPEPRNEGVEIKPSDTRKPGQCRVIRPGRPAEYLKEKTEELLLICENAGPEAVIRWY